LELILRASQLPNNHGLCNVNDVTSDMLVNVLVSQCKQIAVSLGYGLQGSSCLNVSSSMQRMPMLCSHIVTLQYTASLAAALSSAAISTGITSVRDLAGKPVAAHSIYVASLSQVNVGDYTALCS
jgi:hypothetical protein